MIAIFDWTNNFGYLNTSEFRLVADEPKDTTTTPRISMSELQAVAEMPEMPQ